MTRLSLAIYAYAALAALVSGAAATPTLMLPLALLNRAHEAGSPIEAVEFVDGPRAGLFDRKSGVRLQIGRIAYDAANGPDERNALLAIALSHRLGMSRAPRSDAGDALQNAIAAGLADRDGGDRQTSPGDPRDRTDATILRGLAWARAAGVCEKISVALLDRLAAGPPKSGPVAADARAALKSLDRQHFRPDDRC